MNQFDFLTNHPFFKSKFEDCNNIIYYFELESSSHGRIIVPKSYEKTFSWYYYAKNNTSFEQTYDIPDWFEELIYNASKIVFYRDRLKRVTSGLDNDFFKKL